MKRFLVGNTDDFIVDKPIDGQDAVQVAVFPAESVTAIGLCVPQTRTLRMDPYGSIGTLLYDSAGDWKSKGPRLKRFKRGVYKGRCVKIPMNL